MFLILFSVLHGTAQVSEDEYKAAFIERFSRFIQWPPQPDPNSNKIFFNITIVGENRFSKDLKQLFHSIKINNKNINLVYAVNSDDILNADILFICGSEKKNLESIVNLVKDKPILTIGDTDGFSQRGIHINMYRDGNYIRYEINTKSLEKSGLKANSLLLASARIIDTDN